MTKFILGWLLKREFNKHANTWHFPEGCILCHVDPPYQNKLLGKL